MTGALPSNPFRASQVHLDPKRAPTIANPAAQKKILAESPKEAFVHLGVHLELPSVVSACNCTMYLASTLNSLPQRDALRASQASICVNCLVGRGDRCSPRAGAGLLT